MPNVYTVADYLYGCVNFGVPSSAVTAICASRGVDSTSEYDKSGVTDISGATVDVRLLKADLFRWIVLGVSKVNNTSDSDNGWSHSSGGYTLSKEDKQLLMDEANAIYGELEEESVFGNKKVRMRSRGIMPAMRDLDGTPLPREL